MEERRTFERLKIDFPVKFLEINTNKEGWGRMVDISPGGGGMLVTEIVLEPGNSLEMWVNIPDNQDPLNVRGKVVWYKEVERNLYRVGVKFDSVDFLSISRVLRVLNEKNKGISDDV